MFWAFLVGVHSTGCDRYVDSTGLCDSYFVYSNLIQYVHDEPGGFGFPACSQSRCEECAQALGDLIYAWDPNRVYGFSGNDGLCIIYPNCQSSVNIVGLGIDHLDVDAPSSIEKFLQYVHFDTTGIEFSQKLIIKPTISMQVTCTNCVQESKLFNFVLPPITIEVAVRVEYKKIITKCLLTSLATILFPEAAEATAFADALCVEYFIYAEYIKPFVERLVKGIEKVDDLREVVTKFQAYQYWCNRDPQSIDFKDVMGPFFKDGLEITFDLGPGGASRRLLDVTSSSIVLVNGSNQIDWDQPAAYMIIIPKNWLPPSNSTPDDCSNIPTPLPPCPTSVFQSNAMEWICCNMTSTGTSQEQTCFTAQFMVNTSEVSQTSWMFSAPLELELASVLSQVMAISIVSVRPTGSNRSASVLYIETVTCVNGTIIPRFNQARLPTNSGISVLFNSTSAGMVETRLPFIGLQLDVGLPVGLLIPTDVCGDEVQSPTEECDLVSPGCQNCTLQRGWVCNGNNCTFIPDCFAQNVSICLGMSWSFNQTALNELNPANDTTFAPSTPTLAPSTPSLAPSTANLAPSFAPSPPTLASRTRPNIPTHSPSVKSHKSSGASTVQLRLCTFWMSLVLIMSSVSILD
jgi:hypothetical protein